MNPKQLQKRESESDSTPYRRNKQAFDAVILYFKRMDRPTLGNTQSAMPSHSCTPDGKCRWCNPTEEDLKRGRGKEGAGRGSNYRNPLKPMPLDFYCDVLVAARSALPKAVSWAKFETTYLWFDSDDETERNTHAFKQLGGRCHSVEQRVGAEFLRREIYPLGKYLNPPRPGKRKMTLGV